MTDVMRVYTVNLKNGKSLWNEQKLIEGDFFLEVLISGNDSFVGINIFDLHYTD